MQFSSVAIIFIIHSSIYSNDFGWRTIFAAQYIGIAFGSALLGRVIGWLRGKKLPIKIAVGLVLLIMCFGDADRPINEILVQKDDYHETLKLENNKYNNGDLLLYTFGNKNTFSCCGDNIKNFLI